LFVHPVFVGTGKPSLPRDMRAQLELLDERRFGNGVLYVRYRLAS
jgi:dihydrofolate reductase